jgi:hypothetical protein
MTLQFKSFIGSALPGIAPCEGWVLRAYPDDDGDGFTTIAYVADRDDESCLLGTCRFDFDPTQERFDYLVKAGFPSAPGGGPWTNEKIDGAIAGLRVVS